MVLVVVMQVDTGILWNIKQQQQHQHQHWRQLLQETDKFQDIIFRLSPLGKQDGNVIYYMSLGE